MELLPFSVKAILTATILIDGALFVLVYAGRYQGLLKRLFLLHLLGILGWAMSVLFLLQYESTQATAWAFTTALILAVSKYYFVVAFPENRLPHSVSTYLPLLPASVALVLSQWTGALFTGIHVVDGYYVEVVNGQYATVYLLIVTYFLLAPIYILARKYWSPAYTGRIREQIKYLLVGMSFFFILGLITNSVLPVLFGIFIFNGIGPSFALVLAGFIMYIITRHHFLELELIIQRGVVYTTLLTLIVGVYVLSLQIVGAFVRAEDASVAFVSALLTTVIGIFGVPPIDRFLRRVTNALFFKRRYIYADALARLSEITNQHIIHDDIVRDVTEVLNDLFHPSSISIETTFTREQASHPHAKSRGISIPIELPDRPVGRIVLGEKLSGESYTREDWALLTTFSHHCAIAFEKARLYKEVEDYSRELERKVEERTATILELEEQEHQMLIDISHRLQDPLTIARNELRELGMQSVDPESVRALERTIDEVSQFIARLMRLGRLEGTDPGFEYTTFDVGELALELSEYFGILMENNGIDFTCTAAPNLRMQGDRARMSEAITNVVSNAVKYMHTDETRPRRIALFVVGTDTTVRIECADTGIGIREDDISMIFSRFFRVNHIDEQHRVGGTGLGLSITKRIVELHGGTVSVNSTFGVGTTVSLEVPRL